MRHQGRTVHDTISPFNGRIFICLRALCISMTPDASQAKQAFNVAFLNMLQQRVEATRSSCKRLWFMSKMREEELMSSAVG